MQIFLVTLVCKSNFICLMYFDQYCPFTTLYYIALCTLYHLISIVLACRHVSWVAYTAFAKSY